HQVLHLVDDLAVDRYAVGQADADVHTRELRALSVQVYGYTDTIFSWASSALQNKRSPQRNRGTETKQRSPQARATYHGWTRAARGSDRETPRRSQARERHEACVFVGSHDPGAGPEGRRFTRGTSVR